MSDELISVSGFAAGPTGAGAKAGAAVIAWAERQFGAVVPLAVLEWEPREVRRIMADGNQPEATITGIEAAIGEHPGWVFYEVRFLAPLAVAEASPRAVMGGSSGRRH